MKALQDWQPLYAAEDAVLDEIERVPQTTVVSVETEFGRIVAAAVDRDVEKKREAP